MAVRKIKRAASASPDADDQALADMSLDKLPANNPSMQRIVIADCRTAAKPARKRAVR